MADRLSEAEAGRRIKGDRFSGDRDQAPAHDDPDSVFSRAREFLFGKPQFADVQAGASALAKPKR